MRSSKALFAVCGAVIMAASTIAVAGALISSSSAGLAIVSPPPASVALNALESATAAVTFDERSGVTLASAVVVDAVNPGTYTVFPNGTTRIPAGTVLDTSLIHSDPTASGSTSRRTGSVTFADDVIGVIASTARLAATDSLGASGTTYAGSIVQRGLEKSEDTFTISTDRRTVSIDVRTPTVMDELRVLTRHSNHLSTVITDGPDPVQAGSHVTYHITVTNNATLPASNVSVADAFPGATLVSASSSGGCTGTTSVICALGSIPAGGSATATIVVTSPATVPVSGQIVNTASAPPGEAPAVSEPTTVVSPVLDVTIADSPDPVTAGNNVQYTLTVTNNGIAPVADAHVLDTLPAGTSLVTASAPNSCSGTAPVDCSLGALIVGGSAQATLVVTSPATVPAGGSMTNSATATPGSNATVNETTAVEAPSPGVSKGFVSPGGSITIPGPNPATVTLPDSGPGAPIVITQGDGSFCGGPCAGPATTVSDFPGYDDPNHPIRLRLTFTFNGEGDNLTAAADAYGSTIYKNNDPVQPTVGTVVPFCSSVGAGVAVPHPCVDAHTIAQPTFNSFVVTFDILYLSGDPTFARR